MKRLIYPAYLIVVVFILSEIILRHQHTYDTYSEGVGTGYTTHYGRHNATKYLVNMPDKNYVPVNSDFSYSYSTNHFGIREKNYDSKQKNTIRIFTTGDSFSEGVGAPYDSTWPHLLQKYLNTDTTSVEVLNIGVAGSDPVYNYVLYHDSLRSFKPDYLILPINSSDFTDYLVRGGFERINKDGSETFREGPWYLPLYHYSRWFRVYAHNRYQYPYRGIFATRKQMLDNIDSTMHFFEAVVDSFNSIATFDSTKLVVLFYCSPAEILNTDTIHNKIGASFAQCEKKLRAKGIVAINIWDEMMHEFIGKPQEVFTYTNDRHYTPNGYNKMALFISKKINEQGLVVKNLPAY